jgi:hypothetical protein
MQISPYSNEIIKSHQINCEIVELEFIKEKFKHRNESVNQTIVKPLTMNKIIKGNKYTEKIYSVKKNTKRR